LLDILEIFLTHYNGDSFLISYKNKKNKFAFVFFMYLIISLIPLMAIESRDFLVIDMLVNSCYRNKKSCNKALLKINNYQKNAAISKKFSCQTRLLGLEANLIMATNSNFKRKEAEKIIDAIKKYC
tara:strand:- start:88 stop:465 length:378 start_codon:yes stop_codon:yes gene_type:complete